MRFLLPALVVAIATGCGPSNPCSSNAACEPTGYCDLELGMCFAKPVCDPACSAAAECSRGGCKPRYAAITVVKPLTVVGPNTPAEARLEVADGRTRNDPEKLVAEITVGGTGEVLQDELTLVSEGLYRGTLHVDRDGTHQLVVKYPDAGLSSAAVSLASDREAPAITVIPAAPKRTANSPPLTVLDPYPGFGAASYRRDEQVAVTVSSDATDVDPSTLQAKLVGIGSGANSEASIGLTAGTGCTGYCGTATVDLASVRMDAFRGEMKLVVTGIDAAGNVGSSEVALKVTRWKWAYDAGGEVRATPAIGSTGTIYFGSKVGASGNVIALSPSGAEVWKKAYGAVEGSPSVGRRVSGTEPVYVGVTSSSGATMYALSSANGEPIVAGDPALESKCGPYGSGTAVVASTAVSDTTVGGTALETMHAVYNDSGSGGLVALRPAGGSSLCVQQVGAGDVPAHAGVVVAGAQSFFSDDLANVRGFTFNAGNWDVAAGFPVATTYVTYGLAAIKETSTLYAAGRSGSTGAVVAVPFEGVAAQNSQLDAPAWNASVARVGSTRIAVIAMNDQRIRKIELDANTGTSATTMGIVKGSPVIGSDELLYYATTAGRLEVRAFSDLRLVYGENVFGADAADTLGDASSSVALDCARPDDGGGAIPGRPGTLYVGSITNTALYAFVVDARGLDASAPWPKFQHDARNTGNPDTEIVPCP